MTNPPRRTPWLALPLLGVLLGCSGGDASGPDPDASDAGAEAGPRGRDASGPDGGTARPPDAALPEGCDGVLEVGQCVDARSGEPCTGFPDEEPIFAPMPDGASLPFVRGPQGSSMFVLAARGSGFEPGDPEEPIGPRSPRVMARLYDPEGEMIALLRERAAFLEDPERPGTYYDASLFLVVDGPCPPVAELRATVELRDAAGVRLCGAARFQPRCTP